MGGDGGVVSPELVDGDGLGSVHDGHNIDKPFLLYCKEKFAGIVASIFELTLKAMRPDSKSMVLKYFFLRKSDLAISS